MGEARCRSGDSGAQINYTLPGDAHPLVCLPSADAENQTENGLARVGTEGSKLSAGENQAQAQIKYEPRMGVE
jgi:hypothetical protein